MNTIHTDDSLVIAGKKFNSRLFLGTGKFSSSAVMQDALIGSQTEMVTVALRRVDLENPKDNILANIDPDKYLILPNTSGAQNADEAVRLARLARAAGLPAWVKLEVTPEPEYLLPDTTETLKAAEILVNDGFVVLPYIQPDPILAKKLEDIGTATVMPLASPIGSNKGIRSEDFIKIIIEQANIPVVVDAGIGKPSDAAKAMEMGADAVLVNTAIAAASDPKTIGKAFAMATEAGRLAYKSGMAAKVEKAAASSPLEWISQL